MGLSREACCLLEGVTASHPTVDTGARYMGDIGDHNQKTQRPDSICRGTTLSSWHRISLTDLLLWASIGVLTQEEPKSLPAGG